MYKIKRLLKKMFMPVSIMMVPHDSKRTINFRVPSVGIIFSILLWCVGSLYILSIAVDTMEYYQMKNKFNFYAAQFSELQKAMIMIKKADTEFRRLLSFQNKEEILNNVDSNKTLDDAGSLNIEQIRAEIQKTIDTVTSVSDYLKQQKDRYNAMPKGWPVNGRITSPFGSRQDPKMGGAEFHAGVDISVPKGSPVQVTADGVVSFAGWSAGNGNLVVIEHGVGFTTLYAHNSAIKVAVGDRVRRGDIIALAGSTGYSTGSHVHYEVWVNGKAVNPVGYLDLEGEKRVSQAE
jgi:murein DD-endopeptidase MepM/ murein hydrolase activator NlpD